MMDKTKESRLKQADLASAIGAGIIGFGLGVYFANYFQPYAALLIIVGIALHGVAMYKKAEMKPASLKWARWLYWICWAIIIGLLVYIMAGVILSPRG